MISWGGGHKGGLGGGICPPACMLKKALIYNIAIYNIAIYIYIYLYIKCNQFSLGVFR